MPTKCATWIHAAALALSLLGVRSAAAGDSGHYSCSGVGSSDTQRVSLILPVEDYRAADGAGRD